MQKRRNSNSTALLATNVDKSKVVNMKKSNKKYLYEKPQITAYAKEMKDFWCD